MIYNRQTDNLRTNTHTRSNLSVETQLGCNMKS